MDDLVIVNCYTTDSMLADTFYPRPAAAMQPAYVKDLPPRVPKDELHPIDNSRNYGPTIRACYGINQFNRLGFVLPLWQDVSIIGGRLSDEQPEYVSCSEDHEVHHPRQHGGIFENWHVIKLTSPWHFTCNEDIDFLLTDNYYNNTKHKVLNSGMAQFTPGMLNFKFQSSTNIFILVNKSLQGEITFNCGEPLLKFFPLTDRPIEFRIKLVDQMEMTKHQRLSNQRVIRNPVEKQRAYLRKWENPEFER